MSKRLHYFSTNGIAESIRYILHYAGEKFEDVRYESNDWPIKSVKDSLPYGQLPLYEEDGKNLNQSLAIARYVAHKAKLIPTDPWEQAVLDAIVYSIYDFWQSKYFAREQAVLDAIVYSIYDFWQKFLPYVREQDPVKKQAIKREILEEHVDFFFSRFEKELKQNKGFFGGKLSWADFILVGIVEAVNLFLGTNIEAKYPTVNALVQKIRALPGIKEYIKSRGPYVLNWNPSLP